jgi:hypothetical protein
MKSIDLEKLRRELSYEPITGAFTWRVSKPGIFAGTPAGAVDKSTGFLKIGWNGKIYMGHRLAWLMTHGAIDRTTVIKQRNDVRHDCRLSNMYSVGNAANRRAMRSKVNAA